MKTKYKIGIGVLIGSVLGFAYYYFVGCKSGTCPITSNPYVSVAYGGIIGLILTSGGDKKPKKGN